MVIENATVIAAEVLPEIQPLIEAVQPYMAKLSLLIGGIFGLYLITVITRVYYETKKLRLLKDIRYDLDHLNQHQGIKYSKVGRGFFRKFIAHSKEKREEDEEKRNNNNKIKEKKTNKKESRKRKKQKNEDFH